MTVISLTFSGYGNTGFNLGDAFSNSLSIFNQYFPVFHDFVNNNKRAVVALNSSPVLCAPVIHVFVTPREANFGPSGII